MNTDPRSARWSPPGAVVELLLRRLRRAAAYDYTRSGNPTRDLLGNALGDLEGGAGGVVTATGMGAITLACRAAPAGRHASSSRTTATAAAGACSTAGGQGEFDLVSVDFSDAAAVADALAEGRPGVDGDADESAAAHHRHPRGGRAAHAAGAIVVVDNTFLSPALQRPLELAPTSSCTRRRSTSTATATCRRRGHRRHGDVQEQLTWWANALGLTGSPFDSYLTVRGLRTLDARCGCTARTPRRSPLARPHPAVSAVHYPGLPASRHEIARSQQDGFGAIIGVELAGGVPAVKAFIEGLTYFTLAESLGGVESLVAHPATMTHASIREARAGRDLRRPPAHLGRHRGCGRPRRRPVRGARPGAPRRARQRAPAA